MRRKRARTGCDQCPGEDSFPTRADIALCQPCQSLYRDAAVLLSRNICIAVRIDIPRGPKQLYRCLNEGSEPKHEQDEGPEEDDARYQHSLGCQYKNYQEEYERQAGRNDAEWEEPARCELPGSFRGRRSPAYHGVPTPN